ncbi:MAG: site-2 protease family protein [Clostridia bacterium]|nr:site-2 protease family protein [Clostridia bacterium]
MRLLSILRNPVVLLYTIPGLLIGLTFHEWAHAFAANKLGDPTAKNMGRMTLDPTAHVDPLGLLCLLLVGFGWAKPVPVNPRNFKNFKRDDILVSLAGIATNIAIALITTIAYVLIGFFANLFGSAAFVNIMQGIISINLSLAVFNLIPVSPLDGSHLFEIVFIRKFPKAVFFLRKYGYYILIALILLGATNGFISAAVNAMYRAFVGVALKLLMLIA